MRTDRVKPRPVSRRTAGELWRLNGLSATHVLQAERQEKACLSKPDAPAKDARHPGFAGASGFHSRYDNFCRSPNAQQAPQVETLRLAKLGECLETRPRSFGDFCGLNLLNLRLLLQRGLQGLVVFRELGIAFVLHQQIGLRTENDRTGKSLYFQNLRDLGVAVEVEVNGDEVPLDERRDPLVAECLPLQLVAERTPTRPEDDQQRLVLLDRDLVCRLQAVVPANLLRGRCSKGRSRFG